MAIGAEAFNQVKQMRHGNYAAPMFLIVILAMMTLPMPPMLLDMFFSFNIAFALVVLMVSVYTMRPLDFAVFPTVLLVATLLRLALNVASTRVVLLYGHEGGNAAGHVIESFGEVVIGGNYAVGIIVFMILMIINFVVVTKGAGRISEVTARFTLDAMPGKQMAIDADLNAGLIDQPEAKKRRLEIGQEADFYGAMDGASKFVRGDAIAGILILVINLLGGFGIGILQHDLEFVDATEKYTLLTVGDGLVAQIPSLLLSTAAAIIVTRVSSAEDMSDQVGQQLFGSPKALVIASVMLAIMGSVPGMPHFAFLSLSAICGAGAYYLFYKSYKEQEQQRQEESLEDSKELAAKEEDELKEIGWDDVQPVDLLGLEVGYRMIPLVDKAQGGQLLTRIKGVRKKISQELGFLMPSVHIRDNLDLIPNGYRITLMGVTVGEAEIQPAMELAINPGQVYGEIKGIQCKDPAFGLDAVWIEPQQKDQAQTLGYTVVDASTVVATHLNMIMQDHSHELLGHDEVQKLVEQLEKMSPKLVESLIPNQLSLSKLLKVLQALLEEKIPIRDIRSIAEALAETVIKTQEIEALIAAVRVALSRMIVYNIIAGEAELPVITLKPELEQLLFQSVQQAKQAGGGEKDAVLEPGLAENLQRSLMDASQQQEIAGKPSVLLVMDGIRPMLAKFVRHSIPSIHVLAYTEVPSEKQITIVATIGD